MEPVYQSNIVGRDKELSKLRKSLEDAIAGRGSTIFITGEAGVGKTRLRDTFFDTISKDINVLSGIADDHSNRPFLLLSKALERVVKNPLFEEQELNKFVKIFAVNRAGILVAQTTSEEEDMDADIFAGMLSAVQNFIQDSFDHNGESKSNLGRLEYGDMKILMEHGEHIFLTTVIRGIEHADMKEAMKQTLHEVEQKNDTVLENWNGNMHEMAPIQEEIDKLADSEFLVRRDLAGVNLENERIKKANVVLETLKALSVEGPVLIFLEDLHWADESSLFVINYIARNIRNERILMLGTLRPGESDILLKVMHNMKVERIFEEIFLEKLNIKNTSLLIDNTFSPNDFPSTLAERLFDQSKGNPLFVVEMLRGMHDDGNITKTDGMFSLVSDSYQIPATVEDVVNRRLDLLDHMSMSLIEYASCIGQRFETGLLTSNKQVADIESSLNRLLESGILLKNNGSMEFSHAIFQNVIYNGMGERWKIVHHGSLGNHLESAYAGRLDEVVFDLARHFTRTKEYGKSSEYCIRAGEKAENSFALEQALAFYTDSLFSLSKLDSSQVQGRSLEIMERTGDIHSVLGNFDEAIDKFMLIKDLTTDKEKKASMLRKVGSLYERKGEYDRSLEVLARAKEYVEEGTAEFGRILYVEGEIYWRKVEYDKSMELYFEAIKIAERIGTDKKDIGNAYRTIGKIYHCKEQYDPAMQYYEKSLSVMEEIGDQYGIAAVLNNIGIVHYRLSDLEKVLEYFSRSLKIMEKIGDKHGIATSMNNIGYVHHDRGELDKAQECHEGSLSISNEIGDQNALIYVHYSLAKVKLGRGNPLSALENGEKATQISVNIGAKAEEGFSRRILGMAYRDLENWDRSLEEFGKAEEILEKVGERNELAILYYEKALLLRSQGNQDKAKELLLKARADFEEFGVKLWLEKCQQVLDEME